ncbi:class I SAM-dependent methyltransferase [Bacillus sp. B15-48]|uniref:class I SAM-dependent methyltransferase n=1 Tax=Bacillus sp. B15-48 TaxID=1548601 RepID=UPI001940204A|nr:class I SAM-dependent methyltransferase [Bacillus sp. B15-48]MBM4762908.1 methyltransferase domain-containing protein [Bacillus sp. B15-48]
MSFYQVLTPYYDEIFPLNQQAFSFLSTYFLKEQSILDIGAGTGSMAIALGEHGANVTAIEPEETMSEEIRLKAGLKGLSVAVSTLSMEQIDELRGTFDGMYCIGNTLAHLQTLNAVEKFLGNCYQNLQVNGRFIVQLVNYDKVLANDNFAFPDIIKENFTFTRKYKKDKDRILFKTIVKTKNELFENTVPLYPLTSEQLINKLENAGFQKIDVYGNYKKDPFTIDSQALITVAYK